MPSMPLQSTSRFLSTPSARRATTSAPATSTAATHFYPRPPRGGRPKRQWPRPTAKTISIHALREEGDSPTTAHISPGRYFYPRPPRGGRPGKQDLLKYSYGISIHALREEGDVTEPGEPHHHKEFLSTPSARRATADRVSVWAVLAISIHALREEGDPCPGFLLLRPDNFYPRPPRGGRRE